jgi:hypothetical protein
VNGVRHVPRPACRAKVFGDRTIADWTQKDRVGLWKRTDATICIEATEHGHTTTTGVPDCVLMVKSLTEEPIYRWLAQDASINALRASFKKWARSRAASKVTSPYAEFMFLMHVMAASGHFIYAMGEGRRKRDASASQRRSAVRAIVKLERSMKAGIQPVGAKDREAMIEGLARFRLELKGKARKEYEGPRGPERVALQHFAGQLMLAFDISSPTIVCEFADLLHFPCGSRAARHCIDRARKDRLTSYFNSPGATDHLH